MPRYSQNDEEDVILAHFKDKADGRFLDIGAYNGKDFSNTLALAERGWSGVCVEPSPGPFVGLLALHAGRPNITLVQAAVADIGPHHKGFVDFHDSGGDAVSTLDPAHRDKWKVGWGSKFTPFWLRPVSMSDLLLNFGVDFDFVNIDVEATNWPLFRLLPLQEMSKLKLICVEHDLHDQEMEAFAAPFGFHRISTNAENIILAR